MKNHLADQMSPYLLQHAENPVDWYPWCEEAFEKAKREDKPVFLSIGYSACHWCHVMAAESFEDEETAEILNRFFVPVKVDREERPDIDHVYMDVCTLFTGSGGWPTTIVMTPEKKPFFAGTYFPKKSANGMAGLDELLKQIHADWEVNRSAIEETGDMVVDRLQKSGSAPQSGIRPEKRTNFVDYKLIKKGALYLEKSYDALHGGFGTAPKFPMAHNLLFLLEYYERNGDAAVLHMAEKTLLQMYRGGLFDHIGSGFCRYSTDRYFLTPHFEKMLYDNALLILAYSKAYDVTNDALYLEIAEKTAQYILREMQNEAGGFYSAQDADSEGEEGKYYLFTQEEILRLLGEQDGELFCKTYGITQAGNFQGRNIPNLLQNSNYRELPEQLVKRVYDYRRLRVKLGTDDKILTSSCSLMIAALTVLYRITRDQSYINAAERAAAFIEKNLTEGETVFVSIREGKRSGTGFLEDYAFYAYALLNLYDATWNRSYLERAQAVCRTVLEEFRDPVNGGFYLYGNTSEPLIARPKETYDGALPSGNSVMAYVLARLSNLLLTAEYAEETRRLMVYLCGENADFPAGSCFFLLALMLYLSPPEHITCVVEDPNVLDAVLPQLSDVKLNADVAVRAPGEGYALLHGRPAFYVCKNRTCLPPVNDLEQVTDLRGGR